MLCCFRYVLTISSDHFMCDQVESIQKVLEDPVLRVREVHSVRWLSFFMALETVYRTIDSLITFFQSRPVSDAKAAGLKKKVGQELFLRILYGMMDWLQPIMTLESILSKKRSGYQCGEDKCEQLFERLGEHEGFWQVCWILQTAWGGAGGWCLQGSAPGGKKCYSLWVC